MGRHRLASREPPILRGQRISVAIFHQSFCAKCITHMRGYRPVRFTGHMTYLHKRIDIVWHLRCNILASLTQLTRDIPLTFLSHVTSFLSSFRLSLMRSGQTSPRTSRVSPRSWALQSLRDCSRAKSPRSFSRSRARPLEKAGAPYLHEGL